jgi:hypothetical protein
MHLILLELRGAWTYPRVLHKSLQHSPSYLWSRLFPKFSCILTHLTGHLEVTAVVVAMSSTERQWEQMGRA